MVSQYVIETLRALHDDVDVLRRGDVAGAQRGKAHAQRTDFARGMRIIQSGVNELGRLPKQQHYDERNGVQQP